MRVLVAGIGNRLMGDDGCGSYIAEALEGIVKGADVIDLGSVGMSAIEVLQNYDVIVIIDAYLGSEKVTVTELNLDFNEDSATSATLDMLFSSSHGLGVDTLLYLLKYVYGFNSVKVILIGCKPYEIEYKMGLSNKLIENIPLITDTIEKTLKAYNIEINVDEFRRKLSNILGVKID
jgi:hydrogenase maturation protease